MPEPQNQLHKETRRKSAKSKQKSILNNVVSLRVSDKEKRVLEKITQSSSKSVSDVVREAIEFWLSRRRRVCQES